MNQHSNLIKQNGIYLQSILIAFIGLIVIFQPILQMYVEFVGYTDEMLAFISLVVILVNLCLGRLSKNHLKILVLMIFAIIIGFFSNIFSGLVISNMAIFTDILLCFKVFLVYIGFQYIFPNIKYNYCGLNILSFFMKIYVLIIFFFALLHLSGIYVMGTEIRYGIRSFQFIFDGAGNFNTMFYAPILVLSYSMYTNKNGKKNTIIFISMLLFVWITTLRTRSFCFVIIYIYLFFTYIIRKKSIKLNIINIVVIAILIALVGYDQFEMYFSNDATPRYKLLYYGFVTFKDHFPLGSGFATYGTDAAFKWYSPLYYNYGFNNIWGMDPNNGMFVHDTYWPAIIAEFGIFGTILFLLIITNIFKEFYKKNKRDSIALFSIVFIIITQIVSSVATATFFHPITVSLFFICALLKTNNYNERNQI